MKIGDSVRLSDKGKRVKVEEMVDWHGVIVGFRSPWVNVLWSEAGKKCKSCNGTGRVSESWEEHRDHIEPA